jgi:hypothetical protein
MFCSWKTSPAAPCACAFQLHSPVDLLLNHLASLGHGTLILRRPGLSVAKSTPFGLHVRGEETEWSVLRDAISGLETELSHPQNAYLLREASDDCPLFVMGPPGKPIEFTVRLECHQWGSPAIRGMLARFDATPLDCMASRRLGAGAWLDEWEQARKPSTCPLDRVHEAGDCLHHCRSLEVEIHTSTQRSTVRFQPSFIDSEGSVLRIADKSRRHIVYADVAATDFQLTSDGSRAVRLSHCA